MRGSAASKLWTMIALTWALLFACSPQQAKTSKKATTPVRSTSAPSATKKATPIPPATTAGGTSGSNSETFVMPDLVGQNLQLAQDRLQALGSYVLNQEDALGLGRFQVIDSNWQVCRQSPAPGTRSGLDEVITL